MIAFALALAVHTLSAIIWVGGMFFVLTILQPSLAEMPAPERQALLGRVLPRFFHWVWLSIAGILGTGYGVLFLGYRGGFTGGGLHIDIMQITGLVMIILFAYLYFFPFRWFKRARATGDVASAGAALAQIRPIVVVNLILGLFTAAIGATGTLWAY